MPGDGPAMAGKVWANEKSWNIVFQNVVYFCIQPPNRTSAPLWLENGSAAWTCLNMFKACLSTLNLFNRIPESHQAKQQKHLVIETLRARLEKLTAGDAQRAV